MSDPDRAMEMSVCMGFDAMRICMGLEPQNYPMREVVRWFTLAAQKQGLGSGERIENAGVALLPDQPDHGVCLEGKFLGWMVWRHPDGDWITIKKLDIEQRSKQKDFDSK